MKKEKIKEWIANIIIVLMVLAIYYLIYLKYNYFK